MKLHASGEDYLEAVLVLQKEKGRSIPKDGAAPERSGFPGIPI